MTVAVAVAAEAPAEPAEQENNEKDDENYLHDLKGLRMINSCAPSQSNPLGNMLPVAKAESLLQHFSQPNERIQSFRASLGGQCNAQCSGCVLDGTSNFELRPIVRRINRHRLPMEHGGCSVGGIATTGSDALLEHG